MSPVSTSVVTALRLILVLVISTQLAGCLLTRVYTFKNQFCDYQANFTLLIDDGVTLQMHKPVLLDTDVIWLLGAEPTDRSEGDGQLEIAYVVEKDLAESSPEYSIPLILRFSNYNGEQLLNTGTINRNLSAMITPGLIVETIAHACNSRTSILKRNVEFDLNDLDRNDIPSRTQIFDALGPPQQSLQNGHEIVYRFRLQGADPKAAKSYARVWFEPNGNTVERVRLRYLIYELDANFIAGKGSIAIHL